MSKLPKNSRTLLWLLVIFIIPGVLAYLFFKNPSYLGGVETNRGVLLDPPILIDNFKKNDKWRIAYYSPEKCDENCLGNLDKLSRVRLALGRYLYNVDAYLVVNSENNALTDGNSKILKNLSINLLKIVVMPQEKALFSNTPFYFIVSPENYIILQYRADSQPDDLFQDIKKLVKNS
ncbi:MAG: hypothetical protein A3E88_02250 [Legionellales bacterium RIFCSPHIGHO2_12_FULL_35_11]|nr:MAG: hypothetical protein A3E88_02250 [Legionellales bacterium RIFCSPHIGHO2_12_FULL_35_11]